MTSSHRFSLGTPSAKPRRSRLLIAILVVLLITAAGLGAYMVMRNSSDTAQDPNTSDPTLQTAKTDDAKVIERDSQNPEVTSDEVPVNDTLAMTISSVNQANGQVTALATVSGAPGSGTCVFSFSATDAKPVTKQVASSGSSVQECRVSISEVEFDLLGEWTLTTTFYQGGAKTSATSEVTIQ